MNIPNCTTQKNSIIKCSISISYKDWTSVWCSMIPMMKNALPLGEKYVNLKLLQNSLVKKSKEFKKIVKIGRTHLQDATPLSLGQEFSGYHEQIKKSIERIKYCLNDIY